MQLESLDDGGAESTWRSSHEYLWQQRVPCFGRNLFERDFREFSSSLGLKVLTALCGDNSSDKNFSLIQLIRDLFLAPSRSRSKSNGINTKTESLSPPGAVSSQLFSAPPDSMPFGSGAGNMEQEKLANPFRLTFRLSGECRKTILTSSFMYKRFSHCQL